MLLQLRYTEAVCFFFKSKHHKKHQKERYKELLRSCGIIWSTGKILSSVICSQTAHHRPQNMENSVQELPTPPPNANTNFSSGLGGTLFEFII